MFDDFGSLVSLGTYGPVDHPSVFFRYITSGNADPTGRPLALLSFLIDAHNWPAAPFPFKRTNLILHLLNGILLMLLLRQLGQKILSAKNTFRTDLAATLAGGLWMLHPLLVSTTLYIVQRETMLATSFVLLGLLAWLYGRSSFQQERPISGTSWIIFGLGICTTFSLLSKANGVLLPTFALTIEYFLLRKFSPISPGRTLIIYRRTMMLLAWGPTLLIFAYLIYTGSNGVVHGISATRPWTLGQRLLTEPRVLMRYLELLWMPRPFTPGLFNDQIRASTSLWAPATTLPALLAVLFLIFSTWWCRRRWPFLALAIAFYFTGNLLESTTIPLELYFEHRNYLPSIMMYWPLALWICQIPLKAKMYTATSNGHPLTAPPALRPTARVIFALTLLLGFALMTHARAQLWGNTHDQSLLWASLNPDSPRAQANAAETEMNLGHPKRAIVRLQRALANEPHEAQLALNLFSAKCQLGSVDSATLNATRLALRTTRDPGALLLNWFDGEIARIRTPDCPELTPQTLSTLLDAAMDNPLLTAVYGRRQDLYHLKGQLALAKGDADEALVDFNLALDQHPDAQTALNQAALLGASGFPQLGLAHLNYYQAESHPVSKPELGMPRIHAWVLQRQHYWTNELTRLHTTLSADALRQSRPSDNANPLLK